MHKRNIRLLTLWMGMLPLLAAARDLPIDQLLNMDLARVLEVPIRVASRADESQFDAPAAAYVLSAEAIRRSGHRRLPEILRLVPGLHVGKVSANIWAVSSRNRQDRFSSAMLVMIDGRRIYTPLYGGVYWEVQDSFIDDIERIEVVRGPGASLWGANAVEGVINIVTKSAAKTKGLNAYFAGGAGEQKLDAGVRFGGNLADGADFRVYAKGFETDNGEYLPPDVSTNPGSLPVGGDADDAGALAQIGFRGDWTVGADNSFSLQGNAFRGDFNDERATAGGVLPNEADWKGANLVFDWRHRSAKADSSLKLTLDSVRRKDNILNSTERSLDLDFQQARSLGRHSLTWGLGFRYYHLKTAIPDSASCSPATPCFGLDNPERNDNLFNVFLQDRIALVDTFDLIVGAKLEHNAFTGWEVQPTLRGLWQPDDDRTFWAALTQAVRTPTVIGTDGRLDFGGFTVDIGNKDAEAVKAQTYELGYRQRFTPNLSIDTALFHTDYRGSLQAGRVAGRDSVYGFEGVLRYQPLRNWRLEGGYTYHEGKDVFNESGIRDMVGLPRHSAYFHSNFDPAADTELDLYLYYVGERETFADAPSQPAYSRLDLRFGWRASRELELSLWLSNLLDDPHAEALDAVKINTGPRRGALLMLRYSID